VFQHLGQNLFEFGNHPGYICDLAEIFILLEFPGSFCAGFEQILEISVIVIILSQTITSFALFKAIGPVVLANVHIVETDDSSWIWKAGQFVEKEREVD
jgi:hypothetical protein